MALSIHWTRILRIRWFINLNKSLDINPSNLFVSNQLVIYNNKIFVPTQNNLYILDIITGSTIFKHKNLLPNIDH